MSYLAGVSSGKVPRFVKATESFRISCRAGKAMKDSDSRKEKSPMMSLTKSIVTNCLLETIIVENTRGNRCRNAALRSILFCQTKKNLKHEKSVQHDGRNKSKNQITRLTTIMSQPNYFEFLLLFLLSLLMKSFLLLLTMVM